jgi:hypothetical protein
MGWGLSWIGKQFSSLIGMLKSLWSGLIGFFAGSSVVKVISGVFGAAFEWIQGMLGKMTPQWMTKALDEAKKQRVAKDTARFPIEHGEATPRPVASRHLRPWQTERKSSRQTARQPAGEAGSKQTLAAAGLEEEAQRKVAAANKASNEIMKLGEEIAKQTGAKTKDYASLVDQATQSLIREKNAQISDNEAKTTLLNLLGTTSRASALSIAQSGLMVQAMDKGSDAVLRQTAVTQAWNELRAKGGSLAQILARSQEIYSESVAKESQSIQGNIISLQQELAARKIVNDAILDSADAQDEAALKAKLYALDVQIAGAAAGEGPTLPEQRGERGEGVLLRHAEVGDHLRADNLRRAALGVHETLGHPDATGHRRQDQLCEDVRGHRATDGQLHHSEEYANGPWRAWKGFPFPRRSSWQYQQGGLG